VNVTHDRVRDSAHLGEEARAMSSKPPPKKRKGDVKEDIVNLQFGDDFGPDAGAEALLNSEVKVRPPL
jgi:hypothetical protein